MTQRRQRGATVPPAIRDELDQTPAWWDTQYRALVAETFTTAPFNPDDHDGHAITTTRTYSGWETVCCNECPTQLIPKPQEHP